MARKTGKDRLYTRVQGSTGVLRYYADLRDLGYGQVALKSPGSGRATDDPDEARILLGELLKDIKAGKASGVPPDGEPLPMLQVDASAVQEVGAF
jgi:hypothetical protein